MDGVDVADSVANNQFKRVERQSPTLGLPPCWAPSVLFDGTQASIDAHWHAGAKRTDDGLQQQGATSRDEFERAIRCTFEFRTIVYAPARGQDAATAVCIIKAAMKRRFSIRLGSQAK
ncbi:MAG: hypothetical protein R3C53_20020 [Pirellulaceae bacterium]